MSYDVNEQTFEIEENIPSPAVKSNPFQILNQEGPPSHEKEHEPVEPENQEIHSEETMKDTVDMATHQSLVAEPPKEQKKKPVTTSAIAPVASAPAPRKKPNLDDYRFVKMEGAFRVKKLGSLMQQQFNIDECKGCSFFIFDVTANVYIDDSENCTVFIAPCESTVFLRNSKNMRVIAATKQFRVRDCFDCEIGLYCPSQPVIESSNRMVIAPFPQIGYPQLLGQFKTVKMEVWNNHWSEIHDFTKKAGEQHFELKADLALEWDWEKALEQAELVSAAPVVPFTLGEMPTAESAKPVICVISSQYLGAHENEILSKIIEKKITVKKLVKGKLPTEVYTFVEDSFPSQKPVDQSLSLLFEEDEEQAGLKKFEELGLEEFEHYVKIDEEADVKRLLPLLFASFRDEH